MPSTAAAATPETAANTLHERAFAMLAGVSMDMTSHRTARVIGHLPEQGEELEMGRFHFRVSRADARRVHALHVSVHAPD